MKTIIATTDFSDASLNAVRFAADVALAVNASLAIYHAVPERVVLIDELDYDVEYAETQEAVRQLDNLHDSIKRYTQYRLSVEVQLKYGNIDRVLTESCRQAAPFAVVMSATEKSAVARFWLGSETLLVSRRLGVPLLLIPHHAEFKGFKKIALATDLQEVYDTVPLNSLSRWMDAFKPALEIVFVNGSARLDAGNVSEVVALQKHFEKYHPTLHYVQNNNVAAGLEAYLGKNCPDLLIVIPKQHAFMHTSISKQFIVHPDVATMVLGVQQE